MKHSFFSSSLCVLGATILLAGCSSNRVRPDPSATILGPVGGGAGGNMNLSPQPLNLTPVPPPGLEERPPGVIETADSIRGLLEAVHFAFDRSDIQPAERAKLQAVKDYFDAHPEQSLLIEGYCDWRGTAEYNLALGDRRANSAKTFLTTLGVPAARIQTLSKGSLEATRNGDEATMQQDRRAEFVIQK